MKPFNDTQGWELLVKLLGEDWAESNRNGKMKGLEEMAGKALVKSLGGVRESNVTSIVEC